MTLTYVFRQLSSSSSSSPPPPPPPPPSPPPPTLVGQFIKTNLFPFIPPVHGGFQS